jgi:ferredoxin-thioredoxin reductase catalytic subunit
MRLNPDKSLVIKIKQEIIDNNGYCPCLIEKSENSKCPCINMRKDNECICGLYIKNKI